ncbi:flavin monoamine oxidase family protein [Nocardia brevicatena]|uniref:flavin monoamine oxidase family protein n=1 Tax=Nocardia brevicatena TaxID=37327 RepID=UPI00031CE78F|nr:flavin monoamine oxidase family protein [Nocardia brevicatena]
MNPDVDVAVVGAGLAGLTAARRLQESGYSVVVFEARDRVGGRTWTRTTGSGVAVDVGGQWVGPGQDRILALAEELGVDTFPTYSEGTTRYLIDGDPVSGLPAVSTVLAELDRMAAEVPVDAPWTALHAADWDARTLHSWLVEQAPDAQTYEFLRVLITGIFAAEPAEISLLHTVAYIRSAGSTTALIAEAQQARMVGGAQTLSDRIAAHLGTDTVRLGHAVHRIRSHGDHVEVCTARTRTTARRIIVAVPLAVVDRIAFDPPLPASRAQLHQRVAAGSTYKVQCLYRRAFWRDQGSNGRTLSNRSPVSVTFDNSPPDASSGVLVGFVEADQARVFAELSADARRTTVIERFVELFGPDAADVLDYIEMTWSGEEWTRGCYGANFVPGGWTRYGHLLRTPCELIHWAGAETATVWMNYMDGAVRSGERACDEITTALAGSAMPVPHERITRIEEHR